MGFIADSVGLVQVSPDEVPVAGTFWLVLPGPDPVLAPYPIRPAATNCPIYVLENGAFLVDGTANARTSGETPATLTAQANAVLNLLEQVQTAVASPQMRALARAMGAPVPGDGGDAGTGVDISAGDFIPLILNTKNLWLGIGGVTDGLAALNLYVPTNRIYGSSQVYGLYRGCSDSFCK